MLSTPDRAKRWALTPPPLVEVDDEVDDISIILGPESDWDDDWRPDAYIKASTRNSTSIFTFSPPLIDSVITFPPSTGSLSLSSSTTGTSLVRTPRSPQSSFPSSTGLPALLEEHTYAGIVNGNPLTQTPDPSSTVRPTEAKTPQHLLALFSRGVTHIPAHEIRTQAKKSILNGPYIESIVYGDRLVLNAGEAALSAGGGRPASATRAIAACPARYGAPECLPAAMALAHAHCTMHDVFACDARLAPGEDYYDILRGFVAALADWPAVAAREPFDIDVLNALDLPPFAHGGGFSLGLRSEAIEVSLNIYGKRGVCGPALVPKMSEKDILWSSSQQTLLDGWFPWLFVEPLGRGDDASQGYIRLLSTMRTSLAMYSRLYHQALKAQPESCTPRTEGTRIVYGLQTIGVIWHVFAMAEDDGQFPVATIWSGRVEEPRHMTQATAILRQIGAEAKERLRSLRNWLTCVLVEHKGPVPSAPLGPGIAHLNLPPGIPIAGVTRPTDALDLTTPPCLDPHPNTQPPSRIPTPEPSWKPWVEPFQPSRPLGPTSTSKSSPTLPLASTTPAKADEHILAPAPRQLPVPIDSWSTISESYQHGRPTPPPFNYTAAYEYSWPLPRESAAARGGSFGASYSPWTSPRHVPTSTFVPMKRAASGPAHEGVAKSALSIRIGASCQAPGVSRVDRVPTPAHAPIPTTLA